MKAAKVLREHLDSIFHLSSLASIAVMGDFNDDPTDLSFQKGLQVWKEEYSSISSKHLCLLQEKSFHTSVEGSYKYHGVWYQFDQILLSSPLLEKQKKMRHPYPKLEICDFDFLLIEDATYLGVRPFSTYYGMKYQEGSSDHLPIRATLYFNH